MAEPVYRASEIGARLFLRLTGSRVTYLGEENIPEHQGCVVAINHTSYFDWAVAALAFRRPGARRVRPMVKVELQKVPVVGFMMKHNKAIPVDRSAGAGAYAAAVQALREGEAVAVFPEATISRSFELKDFKTGAARMSVEADAPIIPIIVWGSQRIWTKGLRRNIRWKTRRNKVPITVAIGPPLQPTSDVLLTNQLLHEAMTSLLHQVQQNYSHPAGENWVPHRLGGSAPTLEEAAQMDAEESAARAAARTSQRSR